LDEEVVSTVSTAIFEIKPDKDAQIHIFIGAPYAHIEKVEIILGCSNV